MDNIEEIINKIDSQEKNETKKAFLNYIRKWPWFVIFVVIGVAAGYFYYKNSPTTYRVNSRVLIKNEEKSLSNVFSPGKGIMGMGRNSNIENQVGILKSYTLFRKTLINLNWSTSWFKKELLYNHELYNNDPFELVVPPNAINVKGVLVEVIALNDSEYAIKASGDVYLNGYEQEIDIDQKVKFGTPFFNDFFNFTINKRYGEINQSYYLLFNNISSITNQYLSRTEIYVEEESDIITISLEGENIAKEADFINELNNVFVEFGLENKDRNSEKSVEFIDAQLKRIKSSLATAEENFSNYRKNNQVMNLGQEAQLVYSKLEEIENEQYLTQLQINFYKDLQQYLDDSKKIEEMVNPSVIGITDQNLNSTLTRLMELYRRREVLSYSVQEKNPSLIVLEKEIKITRDGLEETLKNQLKATETKMESMEERYNSIKDRLKKLPETEKQLIGIQREFDLNNELYTYMLQKKAEASISKASIASEVQIIDDAMVESAYKVGPNLMLNVAAGAFGGFVIPFVFIFLAGFFSTKIQSREEIEMGTNLRVLEGIIKHKYKVKLPVLHHPRSGIAESFRGVKTNISAILDYQGSKVIAVNSLVPGEGKSFISSNLSASLAKPNCKVLLVGADLHKPTLHKFLEVKETFGLSDYLLNEKKLEEIISRTHIPNLHFLQAGKLVSNPSDLLDREKFELLFNQARKKYDYIIIDNAPTLLVPDSIMINLFSDLSLFILRINHSHKEEMKQINKIVDFNKISQAAIVVNEDQDRGFGYGNKYWKNGYGKYKGKMSIA